MQAMEVGVGLGLVDLSSAMCRCGVSLASHSVSCCRSVCAVSRVSRYVFAGNGAFLLDFLVM